MAIGPVQLIVLGFEQPDFHSDVVAELEKLHGSDTIRVIDALALYKDSHGDIEVEHLSNLTTQEAIKLGSRISALIGLGLDDEPASQPGTHPGATTAARAAAGGTRTLNDDAWDILADIPDDTAAALLLIEHNWAVPLRNAIAWNGGYRISDGFISPLDLIAIGLTTAAQAKALHDLETAIPR